MNERRQDWIFWTAATILVALVVHLGAIHFLPRLVMTRVLGKMGAVNTLHVGTRPTSASHMVVRPSPDILYATCPYDLSKGALRVTAPVVHTNYWSVSAFDADTNNFFVKNDQQVIGDSLELIVLKRGQAWPAMDNALQRVVLFSPSEQGLILFRAVIDDDKHLAALEAAFHQTHCETVASAPKLR